MTGDSLLRRTGLALVPAAACCGQSTPPVTITYHLTFTEVSAQAPYAPVASPNGLLEPGEGARFELNASISPPPSTAITWPWTVFVNSSGSGFVGGFWSGDLNLTGDSGNSSAAGSWVLDQNTTPPSHPDRLGVLPPFASGSPSSSGVPNVNGSGLMDISPYQFGVNSRLLNSASPTPAMWRGLWVPMSYESRSVSFELSLGTAGLASQIFAVDDVIEFPIPLAAATNYPASQRVQIVPVPGAAVILAIAFIQITVRPRPRAREIPSAHGETV